jgi:hypothetical protein
LTFINESAQALTIGSIDVLNVAPQFDSNITINVLNQDKLSPRRSPANRARPPSPSPTRRRPQSC